MTRRDRIRSIAAAAVLLLLSSVAAAAQSWIAEASAGAAEYDALAGEVGSVHAIVSVRREGARWLSLSAGLPLGADGIPWLAGGVGGRWSRPFRGLEIGLEAAGIGFGYQLSDPDATGGGATGIALPFLSFPVPAGRVELRSGLLHHTTVFDGERSWRSVHDSQARGTLLLPRGLVLLAEGRVVRGPEATYPFAGATLQMVRSRVTGWVSAGRWMADSLDQGGWGAGVRATLPGRMELRASYEREPQDPLYFNGARTSWSVGLSRAFGRAAPFEARVPPPEAFRSSAGAVVISVPREEAAGPLAIAGDFTDWEPVPMEAAEEGWEARFELPPGVYHYSFRRPDGTWFLPDSVRNRVDDGFGGMNGVLVVVGP